MEFSKETRRLAIERMQDRQLDLLIIGVVLQVQVWLCRQQQAVWKQP